MKYIIIGLGSFGSSLASKLTENGNEVIGVDNTMNKVDALKEKITHTICLDCTDSQAVTNLPLKDTDVVVVCIGEDEGANIMATALMKRMNVNRLVSRAISPLHETVLEAMGVDEIVHPEEETADRWAKKFNHSGVVDSFELTSEYGIIEAKVPEKFIGKTLIEIGFRKNYNIVVLTTIKVLQKNNLLGITRNVKVVQGVATSKTKLEADDILVMYGSIRDIEKLLKDK